MKTITEEDLTLLYYGEHEDRELAATVAASPELTARFEALCAQLGRMDALTPPDREDDYGADVWQKISPRLETENPGSPAKWKTSLLATFQPRFSLAGVFSLLLVITLAFVLGRESGEHMQPVLQAPPGSPALALTGMNSGRLLTSSVSDHLEQINLVFTQFANTPVSSATEAELFTDLLISNRLYRQAAESREEYQLSALLSELEPLLLELAHEAHKASPASRERMQAEMRDRLLFRIRVMNSQLNSPQIST